jgi:DNA repair protein RadC
MLKEERYFTVRDLPKQERPRERLHRLGAKALSAQELLALVIGRGVSKKPVMDIAQELMRRFGSVSGISDATIEELSMVPGIGFAKAAQLKAAFELGQRQDLEVGLPDTVIKDPESLVKIVRAGITDKTKEHFRLVLLNTRNRVIGISTISVGTVNASLVHPREVFKEAIRRSAQSVILVHNHPSGDPEPSEEDLRLTRRLVEAGRIMGIEVLDHIIVTHDNFLSLKAKNIW